MSLGLPDELLDAWDDVNRAVDVIICALPSQMTAAAEKLETARRNYRVVLNKVALENRLRGTNEDS